MTRTRRRYNNPKTGIYKTLVRDHAKLDPGNESFDKWLEHGVNCMGNCPFCKDMQRDQKERTEKNTAFQLAVKESL